MASLKRAYSLGNNTIIRSITPRSAGSLTGSPHEIVFEHAHHPAGTGAGYVHWTSRQRCCGWVRSIINEIKYY